MRIDQVRELKRLALYLNIPLSNLTYWAKSYHHWTECQSRRGQPLNELEKERDELKKDIVQACEYILSMEKEIKELRAALRRSLDGWRRDVETGKKLQIELEDKNHVAD